jgi:2,4-dienoyl-CoA reductase-like NADH-dependent reductase (Old Yellow Enzyme family)
MVDAVHAAGASIWLQIGHGGVFAMEAWHEPYASQRKGPLVTSSPLRWWLKPLFRRAPVHAMTTAEVHAMCDRHGDVAAWAREAGYDGVQLGSSNAKLLDQFLSPFYNRRTDEFGGSVDRRANLLRVIRERIAERAGADFTCTVKVPVGEKAPPFMPHTTWDEGLRLAMLCEDFGFDSVTPVGVSVFPDTTLSRGDIPKFWDNKAMMKRFEQAAPSRFEREVLRAGYVVGGRGAPFEAVWNRSRFEAVKRLIDIPVFAVGGIRTKGEVNAILDGAAADMVGIGRPFYAEPDLPTRMLEADAHEHAPGLCVNSNRCVAAQMLGMKGACYNPAVVKLGRKRPA